MKTALILIDIQVDYFPGGSMELTGSVEAGQKAGQALAWARENSLPVFHIRHIAVHPDATFFLPGTAGSEIHPCVAPANGETVIVKHFPNSFRQTDLLNSLKEKQINRLIICGMMTHMCVEATVRAGADLGFECTVLSDACATKDLSFNGIPVSAQQVHAAYLAGLAAGYARVISTEECLS